MRLTTGRASYAALFSVAALAVFAKSFIYAHLLDPAGLGLVALALLLVAFVSYFSTLGVLEGLVREVPILRGQGQDVTELRSVGFICAISVSALVGLALSFVLLVVSAVTGRSAGLHLTGPLLIATVSVNAVVCDLQIREESLKYAAVLLLKSLIAICLALIFAGPFGAQGVLAAEIVGQLACAFVCWRLWCADLKLVPDCRSKIPQLVRVGLPFALGNLLNNVAMNLDRWAVQLSLGVAALGTYAFGMNIASLGLVLLNMIQLYAAPRLMRGYGETGDNEALFAKVKLLGLATVGMFLVLAIPAMFLFSWLIDAWYPAYSGVKPFLVWIYVGTGAITLGYFDVLFRAASGGRTLVVIQCVVVVATLFGCVVVANWGASLMLFAVVFAAARVLQALLGWWWGHNILLRDVRVM